MLNLPYQLQLKKFTKKDAGKALEAFGPKNI